MTAYAVSYDLFKTGQNYPDLIKKIESYPKAVRVLLSYWIIETNKSAKDIVAELKPYYDSNDKIFVVAL